MKSQHVDSFSQSLQNVFFCLSFFSDLPRRLPVCFWLVCIKLTWIEELQPELKPQFIHSLTAAWSKWSVVDTNYLEITFHFCFVPLVLQTISLLLFYTQDTYFHTSFSTFLRGTGRVYSSSSFFISSLNIFSFFHWIFQFRCKKVTPLKARNKCQTFTSEIVAGFAPVMLYK